MDEKLKNLLERALNTTNPLASAASVSQEKFLVTLVGIHRISMTTLRDIYYLSLNESTGPSILDLARKIIEHGISIEYMLWKGKEKMAAQFQDYLVVQMHDELVFLKSVGQNPSDPNDPSKTGSEELEKEYAALSPDVKNRKTWAGRSTEHMLESLHTAKVLSDFDISRMGEAYVWGCRLNHPNPLVARGYLDQEGHNMTNSFYSRLGIIVAIAMHLRLTTRLIDESRLFGDPTIYNDIAKEVHQIQDELNGLT